MLSLPLSDKVQAFVQQLLDNVHLDFSVDDQRKGVIVHRLVSADIQYSPPPLLHSPCMFSFSHHSLFQPITPENQTVEAEQALGYSRMEGETLLETPRYRPSVDGALLQHPQEVTTLRKQASNVSVHRSSTHQERMYQKADAGFPPSKKESFENNGYSGKQFVEYDDVVQKHYCGWSCFK
jgi:hypothetical protein